MSQSAKHIVLIGNPNSGKTSLFNALTGLNQKISNLPGTTIDKKSGVFKHNNLQIEVVDLPGTYSIHPKGEDEIITIEYLLKSKDPIDLIVFVADAGNLSRNLLLYTQVADLGYPTVFALNMVDLARKKSIEIDVNALSAELGVKICPVNARQEVGINELKEAIIKTDQAFQTVFFDQQTTQADALPIKDYKAYLIQHLDNLKTRDAISIEKNQKELGQDTIARYKKIDKIVEKVIRKSSNNKTFMTEKIDNILLHPVYGFIAFYTTLFVLFQLIFKVSDYPMSWIEQFFEFASVQLKLLLPDNQFTALLTDGVLPGIGGVVVFLPQIIILFALIAILEDSGYMTRVSFITDRLMRKFGLNGKSVVPLIGGMACAIPSIMSTRNIENRKDRLITILVTPLMSCSARLPVYTLLVSLLMKTDKDAIIDSRGLILLGLYLLGFFVALLFAFIFKFILKQKQKSYFVLELPDYRKPRLKNILLTVKEKSGDFVFNAGKIIVIVSIVLWFLASYGPGDSFNQVDQKYAGYTGADKALLIQSEKLEQSYAGHLGKLLEPAIEPIGYDWKIGIALITSFAAREVFVGTIATIYSVGDAENEQSLTEVLAKQTRADGSLLYSVPTILSLLVFYAFAMQCVSTLAVTYRETRSIKWPLVQFTYMSAFAYLMSWVVFNVFGG